MTREIKKRDRHTRIKGLRCFQRVHEMLAHGYPVPGVAAFIRKQGEYLDVKEQSLIEVLTRYRREILPLDILTTRQPHVILSAKKQYTDKLEDLRRMDDLYEALKYQFDMAHAEMRMTGAADPEMTKTARHIMDLVHKMHQIRMDLGISGQRNLGTLTISAERLEEIRQKYGDGAAKAMADPVSRSRVLAYLKTAQDAARLHGSSNTNGAVIDIEQEESGHI